VTVLYSSGDGEEVSQCRKIVVMVVVGNGANYGG
jgi:hypothetical protein